MEADAGPSPDLERDGEASKLAADMRTAYFALSAFVGRAAPLTAAKAGEALVIDKEYLTDYDRRKRRFDDAFRRWRRFLDERYA
jgi:hypothetical protein